MLIALSLILAGLAASILMTSSPIAAKTTQTTYGEDINQTILSITGYGEIAYTPEQAVVIFTAIGSGDTAEEALNKCISKTEAIIEALKQLGIKEDEMRTSSISVNPRYDWDAKPPRIIGYEATYTLTVEVKEIDLVGKAIDAAFSAGADRMYGPQFTISDEKLEELRLIALRKAVEDAESKAREIAKILGKEVIHIKTINISPYYAPPRPPVPMPMVKEAAEIPIMPGEGTISITISATYILA